MAPQPDSSRQLTILVDSNILISLESLGVSSTSDVELAAEFARLASELNFRIAVCYATRKDLLEAPEEKRKFRFEQLKKYFILQPIPENQELSTRAAFPSKLSRNDRIDLEILSAFESGVADWLVTEDLNLRKRARKAGIGESVFSLIDVIQTLKSLLNQPTGIQSVRTIPGYTISPHLTFFESIRRDYPDFVEWWKTRVSKEHRDVLFIGAEKNPEGIAVLKIEQDLPHGIAGRVLKICTFKIAEEFQGSRRGELLLNACVDYARQNGCNCIYLEVLPSNELLLAWAPLFGFTVVEGARTQRGEQVIRKYLVPSESQNMTSLEHNIAYGPGSMKLQDPHLVPIRANFHRRLFPEAEQQTVLPSMSEPCGNAIRKAYLCHAKTTMLKEGDSLIFLRTGGGGTSATVLGVVEDTLRSRLTSEIVAFVGNRTIYTIREIESMCEGKDVLALLFRFDRVISPRWIEDELRAARIFVGNVQTIQRARKEGTPWISQRLGV